MIDNYKSLQAFWPGYFSLQAGEVFIWNQEADDDHRLQVHRLKVRLFLLVVTGNYLRPYLLWARKNYRCHLQLCRHRLQ